MRHELTRAVRAGAVAALRLAAAWMLAGRFTGHRGLFAVGGIALTFVLVGLVTLMGVDWFVEPPREPKPAGPAGEPLTMLGPVWVEHPESDAAAPPRRFA